MLRRAWKPVAGTVLVFGASGYLFYRYSKPQSHTFDVSVRSRGADGKSVMSTRAVPILSQDEVDRRLREHAVARSTRRPDGIVWNQTTAHLAANAPIEDANASAIIERDPSDRSAPGDLLFFAVMDGHAGFHTSRLLSRILIPAVALELSSLIHDPHAIIPKDPLAHSLKSWLWPSSTGTPIPFDADPTFIKLAIQTAFANVDSELINAPIQLLIDTMGKQHLTNEKNIPDFSQNPMALATMQPAMSGSCALLALIDTAHQNLYVACTGDSRAVAGIYEEKDDGTGQWCVEVLTEDQTGRNPNELKRMQQEHPLDENDTVIQRGRVLGGLEPSRAFGDARYKWPRKIQEILYTALLEGSEKKRRTMPDTYRTPPYVTSRPEVTHRKLSFLPLSSDKPKSALRFIVLATDGLWDQLTSEEVVALVGGHLAGLKGRVNKFDLEKLVPTTTGSQTVEGKDKSRRDRSDAWAFVDENVSTHLIRNAFGGADNMHLRQLLSIPPPLARNYRDDITVTVVWWEDGREHDAQTASFAAAQKLQAKL